MHAQAQLSTAPRPGMHELSQQIDPPAAPQGVPATLQLACEAAADGDAAAEAEAVTEGVGDGEWMQMQL